MSPFAPHLSEEMWEELGHTEFLSISSWLVYDESKIVDAIIEIGVQINGKVRGTIVIPTDCDKDKALELAKADEKILSFMDGKTIVKVEALCI